jgi:hypothetical protein
MERIKEIQKQFFNELKEIHLQLYSPFNESLNRVKTEIWMSHFQPQSEVFFSFFLSFFVSFYCITLHLKCNKMMNGTFFFDFRMSHLSFLKSF